MMKKIILTLLVASLVIFIHPSDIFASITPRLGITYMFYKVTDTMAGADIISQYQNPGVRDTVKAELASLKKQGVQTIRFGINWAHDWPLVSSTGGYVHEPLRTNLQLYFSDVKESGIQNLFIFFGPLLNNDPISDNFTQELLEENWQFMRDVRSIAKTYGPTGGVTFDLANEIGPNEAIKAMQNGTAKFNRVMAYITEIWKRYVTAYGRNDASFGTIGAATIKGLPPYNLATAKAFDNLLTALRQSNAAMPAWYPLNVYVASSDEAYNTLLYIDSVLTRNGLNAGIRLGEVFYDDDATTAGVKKYASENHHPVLDIIYFPNDNTFDASKVTQANILNRKPPYILTAYAKYFPSTQRPADLNSDGKVNILDYNLMIQSFGKPYTIFDYNNLVSNFGK